MSVKAYIPIALSLSRIGIGILIFFLWIYGYSSILLFWWVVVGLATDFFDGFLARYRGVGSQFGKQCDHYADKFFMVVIFIIIVGSIFPFGGVGAWIIFLSIVISVMRELYIGWFKTKYPHMVVLQTAKLKTTVQGFAVLMFFLGSVWGSAVLFFLATVLSVYSAYWYRAIGLKQTRSTWNSEKFFSAISVLFGTRPQQFTSIEDVAPSVERLKALFPENEIKTLIVDLDATVVPFAQSISTKAFDLLRSYRDAGFTVIIYSNSSDTERFASISDAGFLVYTGVHSKPSIVGYQEIATLFSVDLSTAVMIGDSPIADSPLVCEKVLLGSVLVYPIRPVGKSWMHRIHYYHSVLFQWVIAKRLGVK